MNQLRNQNHISVTGRRVPKLIVNFDELKERYQVSETLINNLKSCKYIHPTPIQMQALSVMLEASYLFQDIPFMYIKL